MSAVADEIDLLIGAKGGGKSGGGGGRVAQEDPNTLRSNSTARIVDVISEGPIVGLVDGFRSVFLDDTPVQNEDDSFNFAGLIRTDRYGYPDQDPFPRQPNVGNPQDVSTQVRADTPAVRTINDTEVDAVIVTIQIPALTYQDPKTGDLRGTSVEWAVDVRPAGGSWTEKLQDKIEGKTTSPYQRSKRIPLDGDGPWDVRVRRITEDSDQSNVRNDTYWASYTELIDAKLIYPDTAAFGLEVDARQFGDTIPARKYDVYGLIISVPSNYNPETREYSGLWDGTFKQAWTDNPAWVYYDLATNTRYGAGLPYVDKWALYQIAQYCDALVDDGYGGEEPRFTFNTVIADQTSVYDALSQLASVFRGMTYWGTNTVMATADMPGDPVQLVTPANVIEGPNGCFEYSGASRSSQHSAWLVSFNDPDSNDRLTPEIVEDEGRIQRLGWKPANLNAIGCNSRGQARRVGLWARETELNEGETLTYTAAIDHAKARPGDIIEQQDPDRANARLSGRLKSTGTSTLTLDKVPDTIDQNETWYLDAVLPTGGIERREITQFDGDTVQLAQPFSKAPVQAGLWVLSSALIAPRLWRVVANRESGAVNGKLRYQITAVEHDPAKYARVEQGIYLPAPPDTLIPTGPITPPTNLTAESYTYIAGGTQHQGLTVSLTPSTDARVQAHVIEARGPTDSNWRTISNGPGTSADILDAVAGVWMLRGRAVDGLGRLSAWVYDNVNVNGLLLPGPPTAVNIITGAFSIQLLPAGLAPGAVWEFWRSNVALDAADIESNAVQVGEGSSLADVKLSHNTTYYYYIRARNVYGVSAWYPVQATTDNNPEEVIAALNERITKSELSQELQQTIAGFDPGALDERFKEIRDQFASGLQTLELGFDTNEPGDAVLPVGWRGGNELTGYLAPIGTGDAAYGALDVDAGNWYLAKCWRLIRPVQNVTGSVRATVDTGQAQMMARFYTAEALFIGDARSDPLTASGTIDYDLPVPAAADYIELVLIAADTPTYADTVPLWFDNYDRRITIARPMDETPIEHAPLEVNS
ncbi:phage tail protein [Salinisphaera sp. T31B1]|uniref:host specificity protein J n=1 Tax=Salinisphaera sp. T31B1 TaxID=727963 RepID=UPI003341E25B